MVCLELEQFLSWFLRGCIRIREEGEGNSSCCTKQLIAKLKVLPILCAWNWRGSLDGSIEVQSLNRNESGGRKVQQLLGQRDMGILHFDNRIKGRTILVCLELERFLR